jgi:hypothetical protein
MRGQVTLANTLSSRGLQARGHCLWGTKPSQQPRAQKVRYTYTRG